MYIHPAPPTTTTYKKNPQKTPRYEQTESSKVVSQSCCNTSSGSRSCVVGTRCISFTGRTEISHQVFFPRVLSFAKAVFLFQKQEFCRYLSLASKDISCNLLITFASHWVYTVALHTRLYVYIPNPSPHLLMHGFLFAFFWFTLTTFSQSAAAAAVLCFSQVVEHLSRTRKSRKELVSSPLFAVFPCTFFTCAN